MSEWIFGTVETVGRRDVPVGEGALYADSTLQALRASKNRREAFVDFLKLRTEKKEFRAVVDRTYPLEAIADACPYVETGRKTGIVVIDVVPVA